MNNKRMRRMSLVASLVLLFVMAIGRPAQAAFPETVPTTAEGYVIYDATTGEVILDKNGTTQFYPASITKIMTGLIVCEQIADLDQMLTFSPEAMAEMTSDSSMLIPKAVQGETMSVRDALYGMFYVSANECAAQLAITVAGSRDAFAQMMNDRAKQIGCTGTHFVNAHGLHNDQHYTTPKDMALIMAAALQNQAFFTMATGGTYTIPQTNVEGPREMEVTHQIVNGNRPYAEVFAGKTGRTPQALRTLVTAAQFGDHRVMVVIMKSSDDDFYDDTLKLLEYARGYVEGDYTSMSWKACDETKFVIGTNSLKVRDYPAQTGTQVVGQLAYAQQVKVTGTWGDWSQIDYMGSLYYVYSDYLADKEPEGPMNPEETIAPETRESVSVSYEVETTEAPATVPTTTTALNVVPTAPNPLGPTLPGVEESTSESRGIGNMQEGPIKVIMIVCIVLMLGLAAVAIVINLRAKQKRRRRREQRRRRMGDDYWRQ